MTLNALVQHVGPNAVVTRDGLVVDGVLRSLRHSVELSRLVQNTSATVIDVIMEIFPLPYAVPLPLGKTATSELEPWEHYSQNALAFATAEPGSVKSVEHGTAVLQWCVAAVAAAEMVKHPVREQSAYLVVALLAQEGPSALSCSPDEFLLYQEWLAYFYSPQHLEDERNGVAKRNPLPAPVQVCAPWPEDLGADLGGPEKALENTLWVASDILCSPAHAYMKVGRNSVRTPAGRALQEKFDAIVPPSDRASASCGFHMSEGGNDYFIRAQRMTSPAGSVYTFRVLPTCASALG